MIHDIPVKFHDMPYTYDYPRPCVSVDAIVFRMHGDVREVLLIRRLNPPFKDMWAFPGGFLEMDETLEECGYRELQEETGLTGVKLTQLFAFGDVHRDPRTRIITVAYVGIVDLKDSEVKGGDDAGEARWHPVNNVPPLAFDHDRMLAMALQKPGKSV